MDISEESPSEKSSVESEDGYLNETSTEQKPTEFERYPNYETSERNVLDDLSSKERVEQAMESLKLVENFQEKGQYNEALSCCQSALKLLDFCQDANLHMKFCCNIMQLYFLMENFDEAVNMYFDHCAHVLECASDIDPKVIQSIMDLLYKLLYNKETEMTDERR